MFPIPIPKKKYTSSRFSFNQPPSGNEKFFFTLKITLSNGEKKTFRKLENKKYTTLIDESHKIKFNDLDKIKVMIDKVPSNDNKEREIECNIDHNSNIFTKKLNDIYIEVTKNSLDFIICKCYYIGVDFDNVFISPPN